MFKHPVKELPIRRAKHLDISDKFDCVFWAGDLNFRLEQSREVVIRDEDILIYQRL